MHEMNTSIRFLGLCSFFSHSACLPCLGPVNFLGSKSNLIHLSWKADLFTCFRDRKCFPFQDTKRF